MKSLVILISNPTSRNTSKRKISRASHIIQARGFDVNVLVTKKRGDAEIFSRESIKDSPSLIISAGGDGTFNEVINGIAGTDIPVAVLPLGTTNVLAKELCIPENVKGAINIALSRDPKTVSLGKITLSIHSSPFSRYFCSMAGIGYDGKTVFDVSQSIKSYSGKMAHIYSGLKTLISYNPEGLTFKINDKTYMGYSAIISNASKYAGHFRVAPEAKLSDACLYIYIMKGRNKTDMLRYIFGIIAGKHLNFKDIEYMKVEEIEIIGTAHIQIDGDYTGLSPAKIEVVPDALRLIC